VRLGWICFAGAVALGLIGAGSRAFGQAGSDTVQKLEGTVIAPGQPAWDSLHKLIAQSYPDSKRFPATHATYYVWRIRSEDLVFQATNPASTDGQSAAGFYWFDLHGAPLAGTEFRTGSRAFYQTCALVSVPGVSGYVVQATLGGLPNNPIELDFGLDVYRPALLRYANGDGTLIQNPYCTPNFACGPKSQAYLRSDLLEALNSPNPQLQLEALTWLSGNHSNLTADIVDVYHEPIADSVRYWSLSSDSAVSQAASALESSQVPWVEQAAKFYVATSKPQPIPNVNFSPSLKNLEVNDLHVGHGGEFDNKDKVVQMGDRVVLEYGIFLPNKSMAFSDFIGDVNPAILQVGSNQVIEGLSKGLIGMKVGSLRTIEIPARMAYGDAGADFIPPGADLTYKVKLLHFAVEPPFGDATERVVRLREVVAGRGPPAPSGATVRVSCNVFRLDGREIDVPDLTGVQTFVLFTGSPVKKALLGMRAGGLRRLLVNFPSVFGGSHGWFHYGAQILQVKLLAIYPKP